MKNKLWSEYVPEWVNIDPSAIPPSANAHFATFTGKTGIRWHRFTLTLNGKIISTFRKKASKDPS